MAVSSSKTLNQLGQDQGQRPSPLSLGLEVESRSVSNVGCAVREALKGQERGKSHLVLKTKGVMSSFGSVSLNEHVL